MSLQVSFLKLFLGLCETVEPSPWSKDVLFISIDFENLQSFFEEESSSNLKNCNVGISILDTRDLGTTPPEKAIKTYNFVSGAIPYWNLESKKFIFGTSTYVSRDRLARWIESVFDRRRNIVLVGHDIINDIKVLQSLEFDLETSIVDILDTQKIGYEIGGYKCGGLSQQINNLLRPTNYIPGYVFHNGGNDANLTMRLLLLLAHKKFHIPHFSPTKQYWIPNWIFNIAKSNLGFRCHTPMLDPFEKIVIPKKMVITRKHRPKGSTTSTPSTVWVGKSSRGVNWSGHFILHGDMEEPRKLTVCRVSEQREWIENIKIERQLEAEKQQRFMAKNTDVFLPDKMETSRKWSQPQEVWAPKLLLGY